MSAPVLTGDPRVDQALWTLAKLLYEIAGNPEPDEDGADQQERRDDEQPPTAADAA